MKIYFDVCALGRLTDDQAQQRIQDEAKAVEAALRLVRLGIHQWVTSPAMIAEIRLNPDLDRRQDALDLVSRATFVQPLTPAVIQTALVLRSRGFGDMDALHLAAAVEAGCHVLLTTDSRFIRLAARTSGVPSHLVRNPLDL